MYNQEGGPDSPTGWSPVGRQKKTDQSESYQLDPGAVNKLRGNLPGSVSQPTMDPRKFLTALWGNPPPSEVLIWMLPQKLSKWYLRFDRLNEELAAYPDSDLYTGVGFPTPGTTKLRSHERGIEANIGAIPGMWADIDVNHPIHKKTNLTPTIEQALETLAKLPFKPTIIINSGHGIQAWWLFHEYWTFEGEADNRTAQKLAQWWNREIHKLYAEEGWTVDSVYDLARVLRIPGTYNNKVPNERVDVTTILDDGPRYDRQEFLELVPEDFQPIIKVTRSRTTREINGNDFIMSPDAEPPHDKLMALTDVDPKFRTTWMADRPDLKDQSASAFDMSLASMAIRAGWTDQETIDLMIAWRRKHGKELKLRESYYATTLAKARTSTGVLDDDNEGTGLEGVVPNQGGHESSPQIGTLGPITEQLPNDGATIRKQPVPATNKKKPQRRTRSQRGEPSKDAIGLTDALGKLGLGIRFNLRSLKSEVKPITESGGAIVKDWGVAARTQPNGWTIVKPAQAANLRARIARTMDYRADNGQEYRLRFGKDDWREANLDLSATTYADPFQEWLEDLPPWDGQDRWANVFTDGYGVVPGEHHTVAYLAHAAKLLVIPCVGRLYEPGAEASTMTVTIGKEGIGKSLGVKCLFPYEWRQHWFSDSINLRVSDKELLEKVAGFVLLEIGELAGMMRTELERVKTLISSCQDVARLAFREDSESFPRRFHWCGTANDEGHGVLPDSSENRRFWPVNIPKHCTRYRVLKWFAANSKQLWAQAIIEWQVKGIEAWINPEALEPERLNAAATQRQSAPGSTDIVGAIEALDSAMLDKGNTLAELLWRVGAFGDRPNTDALDPQAVVEVATKMAAGPGAKVAIAVTKELKRRGWANALGNHNRGRTARGRSFWWPSTNGENQDVEVT